MAARFASLSAAVKRLTSTPSKLAAAKLRSEAAKQASAANPPARRVAAPAAHGPTLANSSVMIAHRQNAELAAARAADPAQRTAEAKADQQRRRAEADAVWDRVYGRLPGASSR
jgi:hypothetical protein